MNVNKIKEDLALAYSMLEDAETAYDREIAQSVIDDYEAKLKHTQEKPSEKKPSKVKHSSEKKVKAAKKPAAKKTKKEEPSCNELLEAYKKRMSGVKEASGKKTAPIMKIIADKMEGAVKSAIAYNKKQGGQQNIDDLKDAVKALVAGFDKLKDALSGVEKEDFYIDKFKEDLMKIIKALEKSQKS